MLAVPTLFKSTMLEIAWLRCNGGEAMAAVTIFQRHPAWWRRPAGNCKLAVVWGCCHGVGGDATVAVVALRWSLCHAG